MNGSDVRVRQTGPGGETEYTFKTNYQTRDINLAEQYIASWRSYSSINYTHLLPSFLITTIIQVKNLDTCNYE
jgi:hypothetical protein